MRQTRKLGSYGIALLATLLVAAGAPATACAAMAECPMLAPAADCHAASAEVHGCAAPQIEAGDDCCCVVAAQPVSAPSSEAPAPTPTASAPGPEGCLLAAAAADRPVPAGQPPLQRPAGRALLSLQQTFLI